MSEITRGQMKTEAVKRMRALDIMGRTREEFRRSSKVNKSERGILYWLDDDESAKVAEIEEKYNVLVYHVIKSVTAMGTMYSMLYVSEHDDEWEYDWNDLREGYAVAYVYNEDMPDCSEFGTIGIRPAFGGVLRVA